MLANRVRADRQRSLTSSICSWSKVSVNVILLGGSVLHVARHLVDQSREVTQGIEVVWAVAVQLLMAVYEMTVG